MFLLVCSTLTDVAAELAARFQCEIHATPPADAYYLYFSTQGLELRHSAQSTPLIYIDFVSGQARHRRLYGGGRSQPLGRAIGLKSGSSPTVYDVTAGLGRDAFVLASLGCQVTMSERSPLLAALLSDGLRRLGEATELTTIYQRLRLVHQNSIEWLAAVSDIPDVIYLDPMYPKRQKTALVKKEMRLLQTFIGQDDDSAELLDVSLQKARQRVVVKRPKSAPPLSEITPHFSIASENTRFDVYLTLKP